MFTKFTVTKTLVFSLFSIALSSLTSLNAPAAILDWDGGAGDELLGIANNWNPNQAPVGGDILNIANGDTVFHRQNLPAGVTINLTGSSKLGTEFQPPTSSVIRLSGQ